MKKFTKRQIKQMRVFWESQIETTNRYLENINAIETVMSDILGIEGLEFFRGTDGYYCGIGDGGWMNPKSIYSLIHGEEIMKGRYIYDSE